MFIFTTDNGTASGQSIFNAGMRGEKGSEYEGGHRVPFIAHWPAAGWDRRHSSNILCHAVDIVPTLLDLAGAPTPSGWQFDGRSIRPLLDPGGNTTDWPTTACSSPIRNACAIRSSGNKPPSCRANGG